MKNRRQRRIVSILRDHLVTSQNQLVKMLAASGHRATQATVSRDLEELGAVKVRRDGKVAYTLPLEGSPAPAGEALGRVLAESVLSLESSGNLVVVKTPPGHAHMVASAIDRSEVAGVAGTVAGDDTILVVARQGMPSRRVESKLGALADLAPRGRSR